MQKKILLILLISCLAFQLSSAGQTCRALVLEGGGDRGSYQAGVLSEMYALIPQEMQYDVISGVSAGAINAVALAMFDKGDEGSMTAYLLNIWKNIRASDIYESWPGGLIDGLIYRPSLYDTTPLVNFLKGKFTQTIKRKITLGSTNANTGLFVRFNESLSHQDLITAIRASSAIPVYFPYVVFQGETFIDGGVVLNLDIGGAILRCREISPDNSDIILDVILSTPGFLKVIDQSKDTTEQMFERYRDINTYNLALDDLLHAYEYYDNINFRYVVVPSAPLPGGDVPINFDPVEMKKMIALGVSDAKHVISLGQGVDWDNVKQQRNSRRNTVPNNKFTSR